MILLFSKTWLEVLTPCPPKEEDDSPHYTILPFPCIWGEAWERHALIGLQSFFFQYVTWEIFIIRGPPKQNYGCQGNFLRIKVPNKTQISVPIDGRWWCGANTRLDILLAVHLPKNMYIGCSVRPLRRPRWTYAWRVDGFSWWGAFNIQSTWFRLKCKKWYHFSYPGSWGPYSSLGLIYTTQGQIIDLGENSIYWNFIILVLNVQANNRKRMVIRLIYSIWFFHYKKAAGSWGRI